MAIGLLVRCLNCGLLVRCLNCKLLWRYVDNALAGGTVATSALQLRCPGCGSNAWRVWREKEETGY